MLLNHTATLQPKRYSPEAIQVQKVKAISRQPMQPCLSHFQTSQHPWVCAVNVRLEYSTWAGMIVTQYGRIPGDHNRAGNALTFSPDSPPKQSAALDQLQRYYGTGDSSSEPGNFRPGGRYYGKSANYECIPRSQGSTWQTAGQNVEAWLPLMQPFMSMRVQRREDKREITSPAIAPSNQDRKIRDRCIYGEHGLCCETRATMDTQHRPGCIEICLLNVERQTHFGPFKKLPAASLLWKI